MSIVKVKSEGIVDSTIDSDAIADASIGTSKLIDGEVTGTKLADTTVTADKLNVGQLGGRRNFIINGAMQVAQRGTSFTTSGVQYCFDRFAHYTPSPPANNVQRSTDVPANEGFLYSLRLDNTDLRHAVELPAAGVAGVFYNNQTITLSFWAKVASGSFSTTVDARFGDGASFSNVTSPFSSSNNSIDITTTWRRLSIQYTIDQVPTGSHLALAFSIGRTANVLFITGVQLELGSVATPFEHRSYSEELALCQRYYEVIPMQRCTGVTYTPNGDTRGGNVNFRVKKRTTPTVSYTGTVNVIACGSAGNIINVSLGTLTLRVHGVERVGISAISNYAAFQGAGSVMSWGDNDGGNLTFYADAEL